MVQSSRVLYKKKIAPGYLIRNLPHSRQNGMDHPVNTFMTTCSKMFLQTLEQASGTHFKTLLLHLQHGYNHDHIFLDKNTGTDTRLQHDSHQSENMK
ncbi:hypothetical protein NPIL_381381 [Nephila pilipes]|uniref:Uncharacterized protein n=1 Tax=Nephila pilipes TaxID=299642 RepID=A0A8X6TB62_NEPPI|nr:hypothetical protein NPIL_381381 [Nephila pilipes]